VIREELRELERAEEAIVRQVSLSAGDGAELDRSGNRESSGQGIILYLFAVRSNR
jgi:hypothetical protein